MFWGNSCYSQKKKKDLWQNWDEVMALSASKRKPILIDLYTNWCHYCKVMDATTYRNDSVYTFLKNNFYRIKFNAEGKDTLQWNEKVFVYNNLYSTHDFAIYLTGGNLAYPTTVIITPDGQPHFQAGLLKREEMELLLKYYGIEHNTRIPIEDFAANFKPSW